jgi:hypothetical protein
MKNPFHPLLLHFAYCPSGNQKIYKHFTPFHKDIKGPFGDLSLNPSNQSSLSSRPSDSGQALHITDVELQHLDAGQDAVQVSLHRLNLPLRLGEYIKGI